MPAIANWLAPVVRGLFAMAPPPPPPPVASPCPAIPSSYTGGQLVCAPCPYDPKRLCQFIDTNNNGIIDPGEPAPSNLIPLPTSPTFMRGFDDPQANPTPGLEMKQWQEIKYVRGDLFPVAKDSGGVVNPYDANDLGNGNPPWGSCPTGSTGSGCPAVPDNDADGQVDQGTIPDRHNKGMFAALWDKERIRQIQQYPNDAFAGPSCPLGIVGCDPYAQDCGGLAHFNTDNYSFPGVAPSALGPADAPFPAVYPQYPPAAPEFWTAVPFARDWLPTDYSGGATPEAAIKRLLRFTSAIVSYDSSKAPEDAYTLAENANEVVMTASGTPLAGALLDAYYYFTKSVFQPPTLSGPPDPSIDCRNYIIVLVTDGHDECGSDPTVGGPNTGNGPAGDLGEATLPESAAGRRAQAHALDNSVRDKGIPVHVVGLNTDPAFFPTLQGIADLSHGTLYSVQTKGDLQAALDSILSFRSQPTSFAAPSIPAFSGGVGDTAQIGSVVPSHLNPNGDLSIWSIWAGTIKSFQLASDGTVPVVTATAPTPSGPTPTPGPATPTPTPGPASVSGYPDETTPDDTNPIKRKPVWSAGRVLGYTDPKGELAPGAASVAAQPTGRAPAISVWPGRKMVFARGFAGIPLTRASFLPDQGTCTGVGAPGTCISDLMTYMGLDWASTADQTRALLTIQFLRGGQSLFGSRDEVLNDPSIKPATITLTIGPDTGQEQKYSYFYQDDEPLPLGVGQARTDDDGNPPAGYAHKLGDIFHSEPLTLDPPRYFQYLSANLTPPGTSSPQPYLDFALRHFKRRKVIFAGANDGFLHAFDVAVWGRDTANFPTAFDLGTGREIFAYAPRQVMKNKFDQLLKFQPEPQYFVDGSMATADVFVDPAFAVNPNPLERVWRTYLVGGLRQGGSGYYALDVTQPDDIVTTAGPTLGEIVGNKDASPLCLNGGGGSCTAGATANRPYPAILWEFTDPDPTPAPCTDGCLTVDTALGETWSRPVIGRIKVWTGPAASPVFEDHYVAIFGGGFDPGYVPGTPVIPVAPATPPKGRALYMVDVETGKILYKTTEGTESGGATVNFAPMPAPPAVADFNDDGYLDVIYIGDVNGNMWRINLAPDPNNGVGGAVGGGQFGGYQPFLLFNGCGVTTNVPCTNVWPIFFEPGIVYLGGAANPPALGIGFGTGNRADLPSPNLQKQNFFYVVDTGQTTQTFQKTDLYDLSPPNPPCAIPYTGACSAAANGFVLPYQNDNEKTTSTVFSTLGFLSLVTFTPDSVTPCATNGSSFRYRFFFLTGEGFYGTTGANYTDYRQDLGMGPAMEAQATSPQGDIIDIILHSGGKLDQDPTVGAVHTIERNWKEQQ